jgi:WD40 repeat protein
LDRSLGLVADGAPATPGKILDEVTARGRFRPLLIVVDDAEWSIATTAAAISTVADAIEHAAVMLLVIADPTGSGPAIQTLRRLDRSGARTASLEPMPDDALARLVIADGVDASAVGAVVAISAGLPGVARREAAAWAERVASDRLTAAAASSIGATAVADEAQASVFDDVLALVAARARRDELVSSTWMGRQPYRALAAYGPQDADLFVGRERLVAELAARILNRRLVTVVGASGSGKSSLVRAGLVPLVRSGRLPGSDPWRTNVIVPGADPLAALDGVGGLDEPGPQLLVIDQFEEVFATDVCEAFAARLVDLVLDSTLAVHVVLVVGADHYPTLAATPPLTELVDDAQVFVGSLSDDELRRIIEVPARRTGCAVEPALVTLIAADVAGRDAALPLVSAALAQVWESRDEETLTADHYLQLGGLAAAVQRMGAKAVECAGGEDSIHEVMLRLVDVTEDGQWVRRRIHAAEIPGDHAAAIDALVDARIVQRDDEQIDVVHEVVFRAWPLLASWLDEARGDLMLERELRAAARAWDTQGRSDDDVYRGARLAAAVEFTTRHREIVAPVPEFIDAGRRIAEHEHEQVRHQLAREVRARRRLGRALAAAAVLLIVAIVGGALALLNQRRADDQRQRAASAASLAEQRQRDAESAQAAATDERDQSRVARLVAESERALDSHLDLGLLLAAESYRRADTPDTRGALLTALTNNMSAEVPALISDVVSTDVHRTQSQFVGFMSGPPGRPIGLDISADGAIVATLRYEDDTTCGCALGLVFDTTSRREIGRFKIPFLAVMGIDVSPDGRAVLAASESGVFIYDVGASAITELNFTPPAGSVFLPPFFTADGGRFVVATSDGSLSLWDAASLTRSDIALPASPNRIAGLAPDGSLAIALPDPAVMFWDIDASREVRTVPLEVPTRPGSLTTFRFTKDLSTLAASEDRGQVFVWDLTTGRLRGDPDRRPGAARGIAFAPASTTLAVAASTGGISLYDVGADKLLGASLRGHGGGVGMVAFSDDGRYLASAGDDGLVALWGDNAGPGLIVEPLAGQQIHDPDYSSDGRRLLLDAGGHPEVRDGHSPDSPGLDVSPAEFDGRPLFVDELSDDGSTALLVTLDQPTTLIAVDTATGQTRWSMADPDLRNSEYISYPLGSLTAISPDGRYVATISDRRAIRTWDLETGKQVGRFDALDAPGDPIAHAVYPLVSGGDTFSADGRYLYAYSTPNVVRLDAADLHIVGHANSPTLIWGHLDDVPGTDDVIGAGTGGRIFRWNMATGEIVARGRSADASLLGNVSVSPDGSLVAAYHQFSSRLALFDAETLRPIGKPIPVSDNIFRPQFSADGTLLAGNGIWNASATLWKLDPDMWLATACRAAGRNMTKAEWTEYLGPAEPYRPTCPYWPADH